MEPRHQWFKLELDPTQRRGSSQLAAMFPDPAASLVDSSVPATMLVRDYLSALRKHAEQVLRYKLPQSALASTPIEYIVGLSSQGLTRIQLIEKRSRSPQCGLTWLRQRLAPVQSKLVWEMAPSFT